MKHLPNLLTLANLFCGCIAIAYILSAQPFLSNDMLTGSPTWVYGIRQVYWGSFFIFAAAIFDLFDGLAARALNVFSPIGKDLDSLADVVSFGVAPSMILFQMLWDVVMSQPKVTDVNIWDMAPAFLIACFAALRLARFNVSEKTDGFEGMPTPAVGLFVASFPLISWYNPFGMGDYIKHSKWILYLIIALLCWLMVSRIRFIKLMPARWKPSYFWPQLTLLIIALIALPLLKIVAVPVLFICYILLSLIYKYPQQTTAS